MWDYKPNAVSLADELRKEFGVEANLVAGSSGIFDVILDDEIVYSKSNSGKFPEPGEVTNIIKK